MKSKTDRIISNGNLLAQIIRAKPHIKKTAFFASAEANMQVGFVVYKANTDIKRHIHKSIQRKLDRTEEVLVVQKGKCTVDIYDVNKEFVVSKKLRVGDIIILISGGHGFRIIEDTVLLEIKQGPYTGRGEKERF